MSSTPFMLNPVPMTFKLKSFEIVLDFKDNEDIMTLKVSEQKGPPADVVNLTVRDKNHFAVFLGFKFEEGEANDDISNDNMVFSDNMVKIPSKMELILALMALSMTQ